MFPAESSVVSTQSPFNSGNYTGSGKETRGKGGRERGECERLKLPMPSLGCRWREKAQALFGSGRAGSANTLHFVQDTSRPYTSLFLLRRMNVFESTSTAFVAPSSYHHHHHHNHDHGASQGRTNEKRVSCAHTPGAKQTMDAYLRQVRRSLCHHLPIYLPLRTCVKNTEV